MLRTVFLGHPGRIPGRKTFVLNVDKGLGGRIDMSTSLISGSIRGYS